MQHCNLIGNSYIVPPSDTNEVVILTDQGMSYGIMATNSNIVALSGDTVKLLDEAWNTNYPSTVNELNTAGNTSLECYIKDLVNDRVIELATTADPKVSSVEFNVQPGDIINPPQPGETSDLPPIEAEYAGRVVCFRIGIWRIYIYIAFVNLVDVDCTGHATAGYNAVGTYGEFGTSIYPKPIETALGANCSICGLCGACGLCGGCALCGGLNLGAGAAALVSVDGVLAVTGAISSFIANRP